MRNWRIPAGTQEGPGIRKKRFGRWFSRSDSAPIPEADPNAASPADLAARPECDLGFEQLADFVTFWLESPWLIDPDVTRGIAEHAVAHGIQSPFLGDVSASEIQLCEGDYRESLLARNLSPRIRAVLDSIATIPDLQDPRTTRIYASEALTPFALCLRARYPRFLGSEYLPGPEARAKHFPIPHQDLAALTLPDASFDLTVSNDVFEHLPDLDRALSELARILRPGGIMLATFPMNYGEEESVIRSVLEEGEIRHIADPEYHVDPIDAKGALVFEIPGWDILDRARAAGFSRAEIRFVSSHSRGITATEIAGILMMRARR